MRKLVRTACSWLADRIAHARLFVLGVIVHWVVDDHDEACDDEATDEHH